MKQFFSSIRRGIRKNILVGLALVTPIGITIYITTLLFNLFRKTFVPRILEDSVYRWLMPLAALLVVMFVLFLIGFITRSLFGRKLYQLAESFLERIPFFNRIYIWVRHLSETVIAQRQTLFKDVVLLEYPRRGIYSLAFTTARVPDAFRNNIPDGDADNAYVAIFLPTTPNPTSGFMLMVPVSDVTRIPISSAEAMKLIISAGAVYPGKGAPEARHTLLDKLDEMLGKTSAAQKTAQSSPVKETDVRDP